LSFSGSACSPRRWLFSGSATRRNVMIVVIVLMISCHVLRLCSRK